MAFDPASSLLLTPINIADTPDYGYFMEWSWWDI